MNRLSGLLCSFGVVLATLVGCGGSDLVLPGNGTPADLKLVNGNEQTGLAGSPLPQPLQVKVVDDRGNPLRGHTVAFALDADVPGARVDPENASSGRDGIAQSQWTLGAAGGTQRVIARVVGAAPLEVQFTASVEAGAARKISRVNGNEQSAEVGKRLADPLVVRVTDEFDNPVEGVAVDWTAVEGSLDPTSSVTGSDGQAETSWMLGPATGSQSATASSSGLDGSPVGFTATGRAGGPDRLVRVSGDDQNARAGTALENPLVVRLVDKAGNGVANRAVSWVVATGGGTVEPTSSTTDDDGQASTRWTLGPDEGRNTLSAVVSGVGVVGFGASATGGGGDGGGGDDRIIPSRLEFRVHPTDAQEGGQISPPVEVVVLDQSGNRVTDRDFEIKLELIDIDDEGRGRGSVTGRTQSGLVTFSSLRITRRGHYRLRASTDGLPSVDSDRFEVKRD